VPLLMTVAEVDDALGRARAIPEAERGEIWQAIVDELLERRVALATVEENVRTIRVLRAAETR
jgi:acyl-CoA reductase-like NAD-dependent aldehyde dehydrogenase